MKYISEENKKEAIFGSLHFNSATEQSCGFKRFYVNLNFRRKGVWKSLFQEFIKYVRKFDYKKI